jgi:glycine cleavage system aminomethyltransferase T
MLLSPAAVAECLSALAADDFYRPAHQTVFAAIQAMTREGAAADALTAAARLEADGMITRVGGAPYLHTLIASVPTVANAGYYAMGALRLEKGYRAFGAELTPDYGPVEAGLTFTCKLATDIPFLGREAVEAVRAAGPRRRLVSMVLADGDVMMWGGELILRDGVAVGQVTSAAYGTTLGACVALGYVRDPSGGPVTAELLQAGGYQVNAGGTIVDVTVTTRAPYDPANERVRS